MIDASLPLIGRFADLPENGFAIYLEDGYVRLDPGLHVKINDMYDVDQEPTLDYNEAVFICFNVPDTMTMFMDLRQLASAPKTGATFMTPALGSHPN